MNTEKRTITLGAAVAAVVLSFAAGTYFAFSVRTPPKVELGVGNAVAAPETAPAPAPPADSVELSETQIKSVKVEVTGERDFAIEKGSVGSIDFNEDMLTQVFTPYQGKIVGLFAKIGDEVKKGQTLFTIDSPDLLAADSNLIAAAGVLQLTSRNLTRLRSLYESRAVSQKDLAQ